VIAPTSQATNEATNERAAELMERYADRPMDLAAATLVALAEDSGESRIFTLDGDFHV
jgi:predicted nucleic acid-binding protein